MRSCILRARSSFVPLIPPSRRYVRVLGAFYLRLVGRGSDIYQYLEPLYNDYRKIRTRKVIGWEITHVDEIIEELLNEVLARPLFLFSKNTQP